MYVYIQRIVIAFSALPHNFLLFREGLPKARSGRERGRKFVAILDTP